MFILVKTPARNIELVRPGVPGVAIAGVPIPVPVIMTPLLVIGTVRRGSEPAIVVESSGRLAVFRHAIGVACLEAKRAGHVEFANPAAVQKCNRLPDALG